MRLKDIEASEKICDAVYPDWGYYGGPDAMEPKQGSLEAAPGLTIGTPHNTEPIARFSGYLMDCEASVRFTLHARTQLPKMNKLVREMLEIIQHSKAAINIRGHKMKGCEVEDCWACMVTRRIDQFVERMENTS